MGVVGRLSLLVRSMVHGLFAPAADPRETFMYAYQHQRELLQRVLQALVQMAAAKERLQSKTVEVERKLPQLEEQAKRSLLAGREDLARIALQRRQIAVVELQTLREQVHDVESEEQRLALVEQRLSTQIESFFARQEVLAARYSAAEAQVRINEALGGVSKELADLGSALERAEERTEHMQARASALDSLVEAGVLDLPAVSGGDAIDRQLGNIDVTQAVEEQLAAMRTQLRLRPKAADA